MTELKRCPFCGGEAHTYRNQLWHVACESALHGCVTMSAFVTEAEAVEAWNTRAATTIGMVQVEVEPTKRTCKLEPLEAFYVTVNMLDQTEWGVCSNCGTASPIDATYCCECGAKVMRND